MSQQTGKKDSSGSAARPPRQETFLAHYPRRLKLLVAAGTVFAVVLVCFIPTLRGLLASHPQAAETTPPCCKKDDVEATAMPAGDATANSDIKLNVPLEALNDQDNPAIKLLPAPDPALTEETGDIKLPRVADDGQQPWQAYARPFDKNDKRPRIAIVVTDLGLSRLSSDAAINRLPTNVTLAFDAASPLGGAWAQRARENGHETLLIVPMEPFDYPRSDPGPNTLLTSLPDSENIKRLSQAMRQSVGYIGITTLSGSRFTLETEKLTPVMATLKQRGLMFFDAHLTPHDAARDVADHMQLPFLGSTSWLDQNPSPEAIDAALKNLETTAQKTGRAVGITAPLPVVLDRLQIWLKDLPARGFALTPVSSMVPQ